MGNSNLKVRISYSSGSHFLSLNNRSMLALVELGDQLKKSDHSGVTQGTT
jgi:hypothetical protein